MKKYFFFVIIIGLLGACSDDIDDKISKKTPTPPIPVPTPEENILITNTTDSNANNLGGSQTDFNANDLLSNHSFDKQVHISFSENTVTTDIIPNIAIHKDNAHISITSTLPNVEYILSGNSNKGGLKISSTHPYKLTLDNITLSSDKGSAIELQSNSKAFVYLPKHTTNTLSDSENHSNNYGQISTGTLYSIADIVIDGEGSLSIKGKYKHGIACNGYLRIINGDISVTEAIEDGIHSQNAYIGDGGTIQVNTQSGTGDGIRVNNGHIIINNGKYILNTKKNGMTALNTNSTVIPYITINSGKLNINALARGISTTGILTLTQATMDLNSIDTALYGEKAIYINSGMYLLQATTGSTLESHEKIAFTGGRSILKSGASPKTPIDISNSGIFLIKAGTIIAMGGTPQDRATLSQDSAPTLIINRNLQANTLLHLRENTREVFTFLTPVPFTYFIFSSSKFLAGKNYMFYQNGETQNASQEEGLYINGYYKGGTLIKQFTSKRGSNSVL